MKSIAIYYLRQYDLAAKVAKELGYALALHGSLERDLDLIAVPWTDKAADGETLAEAVAKATGGSILADTATSGWDFTKRRGPEPKMHGRSAWHITFGGGAYLDLSVMPRVENPISALMDAQRRSVEDFELARRKQGQS